MFTFVHERGLEEAWRKGAPQVPHCNVPGILSYEDVDVVYEVYGEQRREMITLQSE